MKKIQNVRHFFTFKCMTKKWTSERETSSKELTMFSSKMEFNPVI